MEKRDPTTPFLQACSADMSCSATANKAASTSRFVAPIAHCRPETMNPNPHRQPPRSNHELTFCLRLTDRHLHLRPSNARSRQTLHPSPFPAFSYIILLLRWPSRLLTSTPIARCPCPHPVQRLARLREPELGVRDVHLSVVSGEHTAESEE